MDVIQSQPRQKLRLARERQGLSPHQLAEQIRTTETNICQWEAGATNPSPYFRRKLHRFFQSDDLDLHEQATDAIIAPASTAFPQLLSLSPIPPSHAPLHLFDSEIPSIPPQLIGRLAELTVLKQQLFQSQPPPTVALNGLPGVGKTTIAATLAHDMEVRAHFYDGILWAGLGPHPNILSLLSHWGRLLGIAPTDLAAPDNSDAWARAIHHVLAPRRMLLVIDDAWELQEVLALKVGGPNCAHLLTTRHPDIASTFSVHGAQKIEALSDEESLTLLRHFAPGVVDTQRQKTQTLVRAVGGLPLALTLMGNYLHTQIPRGDLAIVLERLTSAEERLRIQDLHTTKGSPESPPPLQSVTLQSVIALSDQHLSAEARSALYALAIFPPRPNSFSEHAALAVANCSVEVLDELIDIGILESSGANRYSLHQTICDYAMLQLQYQSGVPSVARRLVHHVTLFFEQHKSDYALLEQETMIILATLELTCQLELAEEHARLIVACTPYFQRRGFYQQARTHLLHAETFAVNTNNQQALVTIRLYLAQVLQQQGHLTQAASLFQQGLSLARALEDESLICSFLNDLGWIASKMGNYDQADAYLQEGLSRARMQQDAQRMSSILRVLGSLTTLRGDYAQSETYLREGLELAQQAGDGDLKHILQLNLGVNAGQQGAYEQAKHYFLNGLADVRNNYRERTSAILSNLGAVEMALGNYSQAETYLQEGLAIAQQIGHREWTSIHLLNLGETAAAQTHFEQAEHYLQEALDLALELGHVMVAAKALYARGTISITLHRIEEAAQAFAHMRNIIPHGDTILGALAQFGQAQVLAAEGKHTEAYALGSQCLLHLEQLGDSHAQEIHAWLEQQPKSHA